MRLFLFDIDCTLLWTGGAGREATKQAMHEVFGLSGAIDTHVFGGKTDWQTLVELTGLPADEVGARMPAYNDAMGRHLAAIIDRYPVKPCPGAHELIASLKTRDDVALGLVTGNVSATAPIKLRAAGFDPTDFPVGAFGSEALARDHLPPLAVARASMYYGVTFDPAQVIVIGDTPADVACGRALGAVVVGVETGFCEPGELAASQPDHMIADLTMFTDLLTVV